MLGTIEQQVMYHTIGLLSHSMSEYLNGMVEIRNAPQSLDRKRYLSLGKCQGGINNFEEEYHMYLVATCCGFQPQLNLQNLIH